MSEQRKTKKWYTEQCQSDPKRRFELLPEILMKYGDHTPRSQFYSVKIRPVKNNWNGGIEEITYSKRYGLTCDVYWQGDSTDGTETSVPMTKTGVIVKADNFFDGEYTRRRHSDVKFEEAHINEATWRACQKLLQWD